MADDGIRKAQNAIEERLAKETGPIKVGLLLKSIREDMKDIRDIDLREAVWVLIGSGKIVLTPERELALSSETKHNPMVTQAQ